MKNSRKRRRRKDTTEHLKYIQEMFKCTSYNLSETTNSSVFGSSTSSRNVIVVYICANVWLCGVGAEENNRDGFLLCCFMVN